MNTLAMMGGIGIAEIVVVLVVIAIPVGIIMALRSSGGKAVVGAAGDCPLCGKSKHMPKARLLYGHPVCKKCYYAFANRRQLAFAVDIVLWHLVFLLLVGLSGGVRTEDDANGLWYMSLLIFFMKDGFGGYSPGKALFGLRTINEMNGRPIGVGSSFKRNLPLIVPFMPLVVAIQLCKGHRTGDRWSVSKVVWKRYAAHPIFLPKSSPQYTATPVEIEEQAQDALSRASKFEARGHIPEALKAYDDIMTSFPSTETAKDAKISLESLKKRMEG